MLGMIDDRASDYLPLTILLSAMDLIIPKRRAYTPSTAVEARAPQCERL